MAVTYRKAASGNHEGIEARDSAPLRFRDFATSKLAPSSAPPSFCDGTDRKQKKPVERSKKLEKELVEKGLLTDSLHGLKHDADWLEKEKEGRNQRRLFCLGKGGGRSE